MRAIKLLCVTLVLCGSAMASDIYFAATSAGSNNGTSCGNAYAYNDGTHGWSLSAQQVAGNTLHSCGAFTFAANSTAITIVNAGSSGNPITLKFETGSSWAAPYWSLNGVVNDSGGHSFWTFDGGTNGSITATANGTGLANSVYNSVGLYFQGASNITVQNLTLSNLYVHTCTLPLSTCTDDGGSQVPVWIYFLGGSNLLVQNNTIHDAFTGIRYVAPGAGTTGTIEFANNTLYNENWNINVGLSTASTIISGILIHGNTLSGGWLHWSTDNNANHHDGLFIFTVGSITGSAINGLQIYNNQIFSTSDIDACSGLIFIEDDQVAGRPINTAYVYNNLIYLTTNPSSGVAAAIYDWATGTTILNNTIVFPSATSSGGTVYLKYGTGSTLENNVVETAQYGFVVNTGASITSSNFNDIYNFTTPVVNQGTFYSTVAAWHTATGNDANSTSSNPVLNSGSSPPYQLTNTSSPAYRTGTNLTSAYCGTLPALCTDPTGNARPSSAAWDMGAYYLPSGQAAAPTCTPGAGTYSGAQTVTCTNPNSGTTVMCYNFTGSPATNGDGATCPSGSTAYTGTISISTSETLYIVAGTSTLSDSSIVSYVYTIQFVLSVYNYGASSDTVTSSPSGISCTGSSLGNLCTANFNSAATVTLSHSAAGVDTFTNWSFPGCGVSGTCAVTMSAAESVSAVFAPTLPTLPQTFVDNNELTCKAAGNCYTGSPGLSLTPAAYEYQLGASTWITGPPPTCTFATLPYALSFTGLQNFVTAMEACRTLTGVGITLDVPPGTTMVGTSSNGLVIPQTNTTTATAPLIVRSTNHSSLPAGVTVCAHGVQDNLSTSTDIGIENPDCTGLNMYYALGPTLVSGVISGITTLSTNTTTLAAIAATGSQCVALANGYVAPGVPETIDTGGNQETVSTTSAANKTGMCGNFTKTHASGVAVTYNVGAFTLANGTITNTSTYNDVQYMWTLEAQHTGNSTALTYCNASASLQLPTCTANIGPDHWLIEDMEARMYAGNTGVGFVAQAAGSTVVTSSVQLPTHNHIRKSWIHADWTSTYTGANSVSGGLDWEGIYVSVVDSQISQIMKPGGEHHAMTLDANQVKVNHNWLEGGSIGIFSGGYSGGTGPSIFGWIPLCDGEIRRNHLTWPFSWLGQSPIPASTNPNWPSQFSLVRKNSFEMKGGCRTIVSGNFGENVDASGAQGGTLGELDPKNNSSGTGTYYNSTLNNVTMADNVFRNGCQVWNITTSRSGPGGGTAYPPRSIEWLNNLIYNVSGTNYPDCSTAVGLSLDGGGGTWQGTMTQTDANHVAFVAECSNDLGQCQGQIANVTITGGTCAGSPSLSFPVPNLAGGNQANYGVKCTGSAFTITQNVYGSGYTSTPTPTFTCASCTGTQTVTVTWNSSSSGISTATGFQSFNISAGDPVAITNCVNTAFNTVGTTLHSSVTYVPSGIGPPASYPSTPWNGTFATGNVTVTAPLVGTAGATETSHYCKLTTLEGAPFNLIWNHNTIVSSSTYVVNTGLAFNNSDTDGPTFGANRAMLNSFMVGGTWGSSAISTGTVAQQFMDDTVNSFTADVLVWPGQSGMTAYGLNQFYPIGSPLFYYPTNSYCTGATPTTACIGFLGALSASSLPLTLADYHQYGLAAASAFIAGGSQDASDGTSVGVQSMSLLDNAQTANLFICGSTPCGSPGPFPDSNATQAPVIPISRSGVMLSGLHFDPGMEPFHVGQ